MTAGYCHEDPQVVAERGTALVAWHIEQQRERARLVWRDLFRARKPENGGFLLFGARPVPPIKPLS